MKNRVYFVFLIVLLTINYTSFCAESAQVPILASGHTSEGLATVQTQIDNCPEKTKNFIDKYTKNFIYTIAFSSIDKQNFLLPYFSVISFNLYLKNIQLLQINPQFQQIKVENNAQNIIKKLVKQNKIRTYPKTPTIL